MNHIPKIKQSLWKRKRTSSIQQLSKLKVASAAALLVLVLSTWPVAAVADLVSPYSGSDMQTASTLTFVAAADAHVEERNPSTNLGRSNYLEAINSNNRSMESYLRFTVNGVSGVIQNARLRVYALTEGTRDGPAVYATSNSWSETAVSWNNRPTRTGNAVDNKTSVSANTWVEYNVSAIATGNGTYNLVLAADSNDDVRFSAREGSNPPQLVITFIPVTNTPTRTRTSTAIAIRTSTATAVSNTTQTPTGVQPSSSPPSTTSTRTTTPGTNQVKSAVPTADAYVDSANASTNFGSLTVIRGDGSPVVRSYLRFNVQGLSGSVTRATLRIFAKSASSSGYEIRSVSNNTWVESTITYNNAPSVGNVLSASGAFDASVWTAVDVTAFITANGTYNLALTVPGGTAISFGSRESGSNAPQLVVETQGGSAPTATRTPTPSGNQTPTVNPSSPGSVVLVGAGDITNCNRTQDDQTAQLLDNIPGTVFTAGDNAYIDGTYSEYLNCYEPTWGRHKSRTKPSPGNHEYLTSGAAGYFQYFNNTPSYYAYDLGAWRIYSLNSEISASATSAQATWLQNDLAANPRQCVAAYWHKPRWSSGTNHGDNTGMQAIWQILYNAGAELVLNGHEHHYERFSEMNASGAAVSQGLREIVVGTGGASLYPFGSPMASSQVRNNTTYGVLKLTLRSTSYDWEFIPIAGSTFTDSGSDTCH